MGNPKQMARLSPKELEEIEMLIEEGFYMNVADFVRMSVREKLESIRVLNVRGVDEKKAKKEILECLKNNKKSYPSEIEDALQLDFDTFLSIIKELAKEGRIK